MPNYRFQCDCGDTFDAVRPFDTVATPCRCGGDAERVFVPAAIPTGGNILPDEVWNSSFENAHQEAIGYKHEAMAILEEETANGWSPSEPSTKVFGPSKAQEIEL